MKFKTVQILSITVLISGAASVAAAADSTGPWSLSIIGGDSVGMSGSLTARRSSSVDLGRIDPALTGTSGTLSLDKLKYEDLFKRQYDVGAELGYSFNDRLQSFARFEYEGLGGQSRRLGEISSTAAVSRDTLTARFSDADNYSLDLGTRYYFPIAAEWRTFAGAALGATHEDAIRASIGSTNGSLDLQNVRFTRAGTVFSQTLEAGVEYNPTSAIGVRFSVDAEHSGTPPSADDSRLSALGVNPGNDAESRWSFPVTVAASYHF
jgi:opacity protein-like surface antigen